MRMEERKVIYFGLLGAFTYGKSEGENQNGAMLGRVGRKALSFLQYLVVNHGRTVSAEELIEQFWTENNSADPANALRNMLYKIRNLLKSMFPEQDNLLLTCPEGYVWNKDVSLELDTERYETLCVDAGDKSGEEYCGILRQAISLYKGEFLPGNGSEWVKAPRQYYRTLYLDACKALLPLLYQREQWLEIVAICNQAYGADFGIEDFTAYQMQALIALGQPEQAMEKYEIFRERLLQEFEMPPTERIEQIYALAAYCGKTVWGNRIYSGWYAKEIRIPRLFSVPFRFQSIVALEKRHLERTGANSTLVIVSLGKEAVPTTDARRLERILLEKLRTGDPVARLEARSYILMLTGADLEKAQLVTGRIDCAFHKTYRHSRASLTFRMAALRPGSGGVIPGIYNLYCSEHSRAAGRFFCCASGGWHIGNWRVIDASAFFLYF